MTLSSPPVTFILSVVWYRVVPNNICFTPILKLLHSCAYLPNLSFPVCLCRGSLQTLLPTSIYSQKLIFKLPCTGLTPHCTTLPPTYSYFDFHHVDTIITLFPNLCSRLFILNFLLQQFYTRRTPHILIKHTSNFTYLLDTQ